jgi:hypothetical protein
MTYQAGRESFGVIVVAVLLILTAWGNAFALLTASLIGLAIGLIVFRGELFRESLLAATVGCAIAVVVAFMTLMIWAH